eukprot:TRINITY_DN4619_c0_g1_i1.p1 TRINITY_DN4619_c0_g1~~TRINITY_DN4619_c0_g1_i1.p1  ORF type:complete len:293 (+),score=43.55 TRINITY_DN4619_c0_g1_i1:95-880(+)
MFPASFFDGFTDIRVIDSAVSITFFETLASGCTTLKSITLQNCHNIDDSVVSHITKTWKELESLDFTGCRKLCNCVDSILTAENLRGIDLSGCYNIVPEEIVRVYTTHPNRSSIVLASISGVDVKPEGLTEILNACPNVQSMSMGTNRFLEDGAFREILYSGVLDQIRVLKLHWVNRLTERSIGIISERCRLLEDLDISGWISLSEEAVCDLLMKRASTVVESNNPTNNKRLARLGCRFILLSKPIVASIRDRYPYLELTL